ncbi:hypothetical protein E4U42_002212 [Claviceps africana]|uniref:Zn(2)-C6 fungal-type domain-containing protein n=1 Tax=Claviceps africana TaxID=83212 RepID=A0A8K0J8Z2_9HYPO|nr:hypothetical protein E4U42_002212 [Claviceps africana]
MSEHDASGHGKPPLRRLLPATGPGFVRPASAESTGSERQPASAEACGVCRKQKTKCSGERPACSRCVRKQITCQYSTNPGETKSQALKRSYLELKNQGAAQHELLELMRDLPEQDALEILYRMRTGADPAIMVQQIKAGGILVQMAIHPEPRLRYEFPYGPEIPAAHVPNNPYLKSRLYEAASLQPVTAQHAGHPGSAGAGAAPDDAAGGEYQSVYLKPFHAAEMADPRLSDARCSLWTAVCSDDALMRDLLKVFFRGEYLYAAAFQKDYFLDDLIAQRRDFCSSLLVNVVLAYASACYPGFSHRAEYWNPDTPLYRFLAEAKRIWELEYNRPRITTIQAGIIFDVIHNLSGLDEVGQPYRLHAVVLASRMRLFHQTGADEVDDRMRNGRAFTAWALYNWETLNAFYFMLPPLLKNPPEWPLPDFSADPDWYGEIWLQYPPSATLSPSYFAHVIRSRSCFRIIMNEFCRGAYSDGHDMSLQTANQLHARLRDWYDGLPGPLQPKAIVLPGHLQLHIHYHHLILVMYEPLLHQDAHHEAHQEAVQRQQIVNEARKYLQTLVRLYYLRHGFDAMDLFIVHPLMLLALECVETVHETTSPCQLEALRSLLILAAKGLYEQCRNHYLAKALFRVIRGRMRESEVALLKEAVHVDDEIDAQCDLMQAVRSHLPLTLKRKKKDMDAHMLKNLVDNYVGPSIGGGDVSWGTT